MGGYYEATANNKLQVVADLVSVHECIGGSGQAFLNRVEYVTNSPSNGNDLHMSECTLGTARTPYYATYRNSDGGAFECSAACGFGPEIMISYQ